MKYLKATNKEILLIFFIHPFSAIILALASRKRQYKLILYTFFFLIGYSFIIKSEAPDIYRYSEEFKTICNSTWQYYFDYINNLFIDAKKPDIYQVTLFFIVSRFTNDFYILLGLAALIQLHFMYKLFIYIYEKFTPNNSLSKMTFWIIVLLIPIITITGIRFWTAFYIFLYYSLRYLTESKMKYLIILLTTPFIHFAFIIPIIMILIYILIKQFYKISLIIALIAIPLSYPLLDYLRIMDTGIESVENRKGYISIEKQSESKEELSETRFYVWLPAKISFYFSLIMMLIIYLEYTKSKNRFKKDIMSFTMVFLFLALVFEVQGVIARYSNIYGFFAFLNILIWLNNKSKIRYNFALKCVLLLLLSFSIWTGYLRSTFKVLDWKLVFGNALFVPFFKSQISITDILFFWYKG